MNGAVLQASAIEYTDQFVPEYADAGVDMNTNKSNYFGIPNMYRPLRSNVYVTERVQTGDNFSYKTNAAYDGGFDNFQLFSHPQGNRANRQTPWTWNAEITKYSPFNFEIENRDALNIYSSALYGYKNTLVTAVAQNARYYEMGFDGFDNDHLSGFTQPRGHLKYVFGGTATISNEYAHSGNYSLKFSAERFFGIKTGLSDENNYTPVTDGTLTLIKGKKYVISFWVRARCTTENNLGQDINIQVGSVDIPVKIERKIDCWQRVEAEFTAPASGTEVEIVIMPPMAMGYNYFDDFRILPFNATLKSYVYDPASYRLVAELDENNYATFYNYDEEGILIQIKKETERGIQTLQTTRQNLPVKP
jgi:hypothetical protein